MKAYNSHEYYKKNQQMARRWVKLWADSPCNEITKKMVNDYLIGRKNRVSAFDANKDLRHLRATFNFGKKEELITINPTEGIRYFPVEKRVKNFLSIEDVDKVMSLANPNAQDYLWAIRDTMGRINEINRLEWKDVNLEGKHVILYTRKKSGGHLTPRKVPMTQRLHEIFCRRYRDRTAGIPWVFWHYRKDPKTGRRIARPFKDRKEMLKVLCEKAGVARFGFHALRHLGASVMDRENVPIGSIQKILGHENRTTTEIYLHSIAETEREAIEVYEAATQNSHTESHTDNERRVRSVDPTDA